MKLFLLTLLLWVGYASVPEHDNPMALFTLTAAAESLQVTIEFDREDYLAVMRQVADPTDLTVLQTYLQQTTRWTINGCEEVISVQRIQPDQEHHFLLQGQIHVAPADIQHLVVKNSFLLEVIDQTNVLLLEIGDHSRGFRMHADRQQITVKL